MKFIHAADIHLDSPLRGLERYEGAPVEEIRDATRGALDNLVALAIEEAVDFVLIAGDVFDGDCIDFKGPRFFVDRMSRLAAANIPVFLLAGNHDAESVMSRKIRHPDKVYTFSTKKPQTMIVAGLDVAIHGQGFANRAVTEDLSQSYPQASPGMFNIGLLHTCLDGRLGHDPYAPCTIEGLRSKGYDYWALGHVHTRKEISTDPWIVFPGNIQGRHARETGAKGCTVVSVDDARNITVEHRDLDVMRWVRCDVDASSCTNTDEVYEQVRTCLQQVLDSSNDRMAAVRLELSGASSAHPQLIQTREHCIQEYRSLATALGGAGLWIEKVSIKTRPTVSLENTISADDAIGGLLRTISDMKIDDALLEEFAAELQPLSTKLPLQVRTGDEAFDPFDPVESDTLKAALEDIKQLLLSRLLQTDSGRSS